MRLGHIEVSRTKRVWGKRDQRISKPRLRRKRGKPLQRLKKMPLLLKSQGFFSSAVDIAQKCRMKRRPRLLRQALNCGFKEADSRDSAFRLI
jgi:hypothetical protein